MCAAWRFTTALALLAAAGAVVYLVPAVQEKFNTAALYAFPVTLGPWNATEGVPEWALPIDPRERAAIRRTYRTGRELAWVSVAVFTRQDDISRRVSINLIYPERNSSLLEPVPITVPTVGAVPTPLSLSARLVHQERQNILVAYWHQIGRRPFGSELRYRMSLMRDIIVSRRGDSILVRIAVPVASQESMAESLSTISGLAPLLQQAVGDTLGIGPKS
jgi:EpsI family protein